MKTPDRRRPDRTEPSALDEAVRRALEPSSRQVERVLHSVRHAHPVPSPLRLMRPWAVAAGILLALVALQLHTPEPPIEPRPETPETAVLSLSNASGLVQLTAGDGIRLLVVPATDSERRPR